MAITHVTNDKNGYNNGVANTLTIVPVSSVVSGNLGIIVARIGGATRTLTVSSNRGTWQIDQSTAGTNTGANLYIFSTIFSSSGAESILIDGDSTDNVHILGAFAEFSGIASTSWFDKTAEAADGGFGTALDSGNTATISQADELLIGAGAIGGDTTFTAGTSYTLFSNAGSTGLGAEWRIVSSAAAYKATFTTAAAGWWTASIATYKGAAAAATGHVSVHVNP